MQEERARFASMEAELDEMRRMVREKEENEAANGGHRPEVGRFALGVAEVWFVGLDG